MGREQTRDRIVSAAELLFYTNGYQATGVDRIAEESGLTKKTLYSHFNTKTDLVVAALNRRGAAWLDWLERETSRARKDGQDSFIALLDALHAWMARCGNNGCMFMNALSEYEAVAPESRAVRAAVECHKRENLKFLELLAREERLAEPEQAARHVAMIIEGTTAQARIVGADQAIADAKRLLAALGLAELRPR